MDELTQYIKSVYGWTVEDEKPKSPKSELPNFVKDRIEYFREMLDDGLTFMGCLSYVFSDEKPKEYDFMATKSWLPKSEEFKKWERLYSNSKQMAVAVYLIYQ